MTITRNQRTAWALITAGFLGGCSSADSGGFSGPGAGVGQGGAQDFGQFRRILDGGGVPGPETLDDVGFFNEHKIELPPPTCEGTLCLHGQLGVMGNMITGSNCTLLLLGMNTPLDPSTIERPPLNLAIAIDTSGSMAGEPIGYVREGLTRMLDDLRPDDRVSLVAFGDNARMAVEHATGSDPDLALAIQTLEAGGMTNIYDGLRTAYETVAAHVDPDRQNRVILLSDGEATAGILNEGKLLEMSTQWAEAGVGLTTIGVGDQFNPVLMRRLSEVGSGSFYFLEDPRAIEEVFEEEVQAFLVPLAEDVHIELEVGDAYALRAIYGTKLFELQGNGVHIDIPTVQIAHRSSEQDPSQERRGGGGAIVAELIPRADSSTRGADTVGVLGMNYGIPGTETIGNEQLRIGSELAPGETPEDGVFSGAAVEKAFVMVNVFAGFEMAATRATWGDDRGALGVLDPLAESVETWLEDHPDTDIEDDLGYIYKFMDNLRARGAELPPPERHPPEPWPRD